MNPTNPNCPEGNPESTGTDASPHGPLAYLAATPYWFVEGLGEAQIARSKDGREIAIYFDDATQEHWVSPAREWRRLIDDELDYGEWCTGVEGIEVNLNDSDVFESELAPDMSERDRVWAALENARSEYFRWFFAHDDPATDPELELERQIFRELSKALRDMRGQPLP